jgi:hypothetical protein
MKRLNMPPQVFRLVLLTLGIIGSYSVMRFFLRPDSFGEHGHYRGAALGEMAARETVFAGAKACTECHEEVFALRDKHEHRRISCESCHGPAKEHAKDPDKTTTKFDQAMCLRCHHEEPARPKSQKQILPADHYEGKCLECHLPHQPKESP